MISQNDLYDIAFALIVIRNNIRYEYNREILKKIIHVLVDKEGSFEDNQIRKALASINGLDREQWNYVYYNNVYVHHRFLQDKNIYNLIVILCEKLYCLLESNSFVVAYDLVDCFHCLPDIIADNNFTIPKSFWKVYIKPYRDKWDKRFLIMEEKAIKRS